MLRKCALFVLLVCLTTSAANDNLLRNGDFEFGDNGSWSKWWGGNSDIADHSMDYGGSPNIDAAIWWCDDGYEQIVPIGSAIYTLSGDLLNSSFAPLGGGRRTVLEAEIGRGSDVWWTQEVFIDKDAPQNTWQNLTMHIDNTAAGASWVKVVLMQWDDYGWATGYGNSYFDNIVLEQCNCPNKPAGDLNNDCRINFVDFSMMAEGWADDYNNMVLNGDFELGDNGSWSKWWGGNTQIGDHSADYGGSANIDAGIWWWDDGFEQEVSIGPGVYTLSGNLLNSSSFPLGDGRRTILKAEIVAAGTVWWTQEAFINEYSARDTWHNVSMVIDNSVAGADTVKIVLMQWDDYGWMGMGFGNSYFDNIALVDCGGCMRASGDLNYDWDVDWLDVSIMTGDWLEDLSTPP
ncbi:MAG TPA: hypothetical protein VMW16_07520 [Sedimentisphaerales bacterium]|nr:hypothetical protein [Sedimentisphaerales bacterium]